MSWAAKQTATRTEDIAYSLLGLFDVNMPMLYGEGQNAFIRLQEEIMTKSNDQSIFVWEDTVYSNPGLLALGPYCFEGAGTITSWRSNDCTRAFTLTNAGLNITLPMIRGSSGRDDPYAIAVLACRYPEGRLPCQVSLARRKHTRVKLPPPFFASRQLYAESWHVASSRNTFSMDVDDVERNKTRKQIFRYLLS